MNAKTLRKLTGTNPPEPIEVEFMCDDAVEFSSEEEPNEPTTDDAVDEYLRDEGLL